MTLKPCPFCGGTNLETGTTFGGDCIRVICRTVGCRAIGPVTPIYQGKQLDTAPEVAGRRWNRRKEPKVKP